MLKNEQTLCTLAERILINCGSERGFVVSVRSADDADGRRLLAANAIRLGWLEFQSLPAGIDEATLLARCEHAEGHALEIYRNALDDVLPDDVRIGVERQFEGVIDDHERLLALQHARTLAERVAVGRAAPPVVALVRGARSG